ncbi:DgyrCDS5652 [Dimorphilus gyrociliatus]|uniref:DgyrCDS5652 n=1 Tax=Dimorphilus gyrociliatus TaxID=2664684 RepID=A0A7I8VMV1_9ANNE|nr:DgyrCDS5652 [Dimorphilus gyrociliatus]
MNSKGDNGRIFEETCVVDWTCDQVSSWLQQTGFGCYTELFTVTHKIDGKALLTLTENDLRQAPLAIKILGDIKKLMINISNLRSKNRNGLQTLGLDNHSRKYYHSLSTTELLEVETKHISSQLLPEYFKLIVSYFYMSISFMITAFVMVIVHDRVPDMKKYPPLPDIVLDNLPYIPWAFDLCEFCGAFLMFLLVLILFFHKHRFIIMRRLFAISGTIFLLRCITMLITSLSVPGAHLQCAPKSYGDLWAKLNRAFVISKGFGMSLQGVRTCGDYMFSGHTVVITILNFAVTEYTPKRFYWIQTVSWITNIFGIFFILAAHEHYSIDVFIAFYITSRLFLYYHTLAGINRKPSVSSTVWFPLFSYFESNIDGPLPNDYEWPLKFNELKLSIQGFYKRKMS